MTPVPTFAGIEITTRCQAACPHCPQPTMARKGLDMPTAEVLDLIDQIADMGAKRFSPHQYGEPTLHPGFPEILAHAKARGLATKVYTNAGLLHVPRVRQAILDHSDELVFSVDGLSPETMKRARPGLNPERIFEAVEGFLKEPGRCRTTVRMTEFDWNAHEVEGFIERWKKAGAEAVVAVKEVVAADATGPRDTSIPCNRPFEHLSIRVDGEVSLCCRDWQSEYILGNTRENTLAEVWSGEAAVRIRALHLAGESANIDLCRVCSWQGAWKGAK